MQRLLSIVAVVLALGLAAAPARAEEPHKADKADKTTKPGTTVDMPILVAPMVVDGKLYAYAYVSSSIVATSPEAAIDVRGMTAFIQDAFVRDVNGAEIGKPQAPDQIDSDGLKARLLADVRRIVGAGKAASIQFTQVQISLLRPAAG